MNKTTLKAVALVVVLVYVLGYMGKRGWLPSAF